MIVIKLEKIADADFYIERYRRLKTDAEAHKMRCTSQKSIVKAENDIADYERKIERHEKILAELNAEKANALAMLQTTKSEVILAYYWTDEYGYAETDIERILFPSYDSAISYYTERKKGNGGYFQGWIEVRPIGEFAKMEELQAKIAEMTSEFERLEKGE